MTITKTGHDLLVAFAILQEDWDRASRTYLDNFRPFVIEAMRGNTGVSTAEISQHIKYTYAIVMPQGPLNTLLKRMRKEEFLSGDKTAGWSAAKRLEAVELLAPSVAKAERGVKALISDLADYAHERHKLDWNSRLAEAALQAFVENWSLTLKLMRSELLGEAGMDEPLPLSDDYVVASYVLHINDHDPEAFDWFLGVVKGNMVSVGLYLDQGFISSRMDELTIFFDTPILLDLLAGTPTQAGAVRSLVDLAEGLGARLSYFEHSLEEVQAVLDSQANSLRQARDRKSEGRARSTLDPTLGAADLERVSQEAPRRLNKLKFSPSPATQSTQRSCDTESLHSELQQVVGYSNAGTRDKDVQSLDAVYGRRRGRNSEPLHRSKAVFVTSNTELVKAAAGFFGTERTTPLAFSDDELATVLWLKSPTPTPDLPWVRLIADCHAALSPPDQLWAKYLKAVGRLEEDGEIDEEAYFLARHANESRAALMQRTHGKSERFNDNTVEDVLSDARKAIAAPAEVALEVERASSRTVEAENRRLKAADVRQKAKAKSDKATAYAQGGTDAKRVAAEKITTLVSRGLAALVLATVVAGLLLPTSVQPSWLGSLSVLSGIALAAASTYGWSVAQKMTATLRPAAARLVMYLHTADEPDATSE
ncbi:hypothetical protein BH24ACT15_BH24ACT15_32760 [soil metagenome]